MDHDQNFKNLILDYPRPALNFFAQPEAEVIPEEARMLPLRQEQLQDRLGDRFRELDTPLLVEWQNGREAVVFILEEESDPARFSIHRLVHYCVDLAELLSMDRVVPVVIFLKPGSYRQELVLATAQMTYLSFRYRVCDLGRLPVDDYLQSSNVVARVLMPLMKYAPERRVEVCQQALAGLVELEPNLDRCLKYADFSTRYARLSEADRAELKNRLTRSKTTEAIMGGIFQEEREDGRREGFQQGIQQGIQQGRQEALREGLLKAIQFGLELKFGMAGLALLPDIQKLQDLDLLNTIQEALKIANSPQEIRLLWEPPMSH